MVFDRYENGFDNCVPPVCREDINIDIININCTEDKILYVDWTVSDLHNRSVDSNSLLWGCDNTSFNNIVDPLNNSNPFNSYFDVSSCDGIIYLKVKIRIETSFFESAECVYDTSVCGEDSSEVYKVNLSVCDISQDPVEYDLYIIKNAVPQLPFYFKYDDMCWEVTNSIILEKNQVTGVVLENLDDVEVFDTVFDCCTSIGEIS